MRFLHFAMTFGLASVLLIGLALPSRADHFWDIGGHHHDNVSIGIGIGVVDISTPVRVIQRDPQDEAAIFKQWYADQVRSYTDVDEETGERICDIAQIVTDVNDRYLLVVDESNVRNTLLVNSRTRIIFPKDSQVQSIAPDGTAKLSTIMRTGDIIIANGHLHAHDLIAHSIRVVGHARGLADDASSAPSYGARIFGVVDTVDGAQGTVVIRMNDGRRTVLLDRDGAVWFDGKQQQLVYLRPDDRVIVYCRNRDLNQNVSAFRIVLLRKDDIYPVGDTPCWADPDAVLVDSTVPGAYLEGDVEYITTGVFFDTVYIRTHDGHHEHFNYPHSVNYFDGHGHQVRPHDLHAGSTLRIHYSDIAGNHFAHRLEVKK